VLLRLDEHRRLRGEPALGPVLMTADARSAGLDTPVVTATDTPLARETDYGRVDDHSSAIRAAGDARHTHNRVPDYPVPGTATVFGGWVGGRITASSSSSDATALPDVAPASSPAAVVDGDPATSWVSNALQSAVGQWLRVDFEHPVTNGTLTVTPSATAVGSQVRRIQVSTVTGTTTLRFDEAGKPLTTALPYGETPWVRITAAGTDDGSPGVQFGITELSVTQYDASGFAHPIVLQHTALVPAPPPGAEVARWDLGAELLGRPGCASAPDAVRCAGSMALAPEEPVIFSRTLSVPRPMEVRPALWVRPRQGPNLADLIAQPDTVRATGDSDLLDVQGSAYAATDGDPATAWTAPQRAVAHKTPPTLTLTLPRRTEVAGLRLTAARSPVPTRPTLVAVNLGDGPQIRELPDTARADTHTVSLQPQLTDTVTVSLLDWENVIDRTALGFDQLKPPGLAEVVVLGADGSPVAAADPSENRSRTITVDCDHGPVIGVAGRFVHTSISTTVGALADQRPVAAHVCDDRPIALPPGQQELLISSGAAFVVDSAQLSGPLATRLPGDAAAALTPTATGVWGAARREVRVAAAPVSRVLVVPESINPGWVARTDTGTRLVPVTVNGWQQGWVLPAGTAGTVALTFASNWLYRVGLAGGLALLPLLALLAWWPARNRRGDRAPQAPPRPWAPRRWLAGAAGLGIGAVIAGTPGVAVFGTALGLLYGLRHRPGAYAAVTLSMSSGGLIAAGAVLARHPWRSVDGYAGHWVGVQLLALISVAVLAASAVVRPPWNDEPVTARLPVFRPGR
jgi:arabinofuranan 3-O-arabinosyltransferase